MGPTCLPKRCSGWRIVRVERGTCAHLPDFGRLIERGRRNNTRAVRRPGERTYSIAVPLVDELCVTTQRLPQSYSGVRRARSNRLAIWCPCESLDSIRMILASTICPTHPSLYFSFVWFECIGSGRIMSKE